MKQADVSVLVIVPMSHQAKNIIGYSVDFHELEWRCVVSFAKMSKQHRQVVEVGACKL